jgi:hypothetical protein
MVATSRRLAVSTTERSPDISFVTYNRPAGVEGDDVDGVVEDEDPGSAEQAVTRRTDARTAIPKRTLGVPWAAGTTVKGWPVA